MFVAIGVLLQVKPPLYSALSFSRLMHQQATKGVSGLYDAIEHLFEKIVDCLDRVFIYLQPSSSPPVPALMNILVQACVQILKILAMTTRYCRSSTDSNLRAIYRRSSEFLVKLLMRRP